MIFVKNACIHTMAGSKIQNGCMIVEDGLIKEIGTDINPPINAEIIDCNGNNIYPGFIDAHSQLGIVESGLGFEGRDGHEGQPVTPHFRGYDAINPLDKMFSVANSGGVTTAIIGPVSGRGTVIAGSMSAINTFGTCIDDMLLEENVGIRCAMGPVAKHAAFSSPKVPSSRTSIAAILRETLLKTKQYKAIKEDRPQPFMLPFEAMIPVIEKKLPLVIHVNLKEDIFSAIRLAKEYDINIVLLFVAEAHLIAKDIAKEGYPCLVGPLHSPNNRPELRYHSKTSPLELHKAGAKFAIIGNSGKSKSDAINIMAMLAHAEGLSEEEAIKAITIYPAQIYGIDNKVGSLEVGKQADFIIYKGSPLTRNGEVQSVYVKGENTYKC